jgi:alpha-tubulin suppressor-like RCC1 family protein
MITVRYLNYFFFIAIAVLCSSALGKAQCFDHISSAGGHCIVQTSDSGIYAWGFNTSGQVGNNTAINQPLPVLIHGNKNWRLICAGHQSSLALTDGGDLVTWGSNTAGQTGNGVGPDVLTPVQVCPGFSWRTASTVNYHCLAIRNDGSLWAWGSNGYGQLGDSTSNNAKAVPVRVGTDTNWRSVFAGHSVSFAIRNDGTLWSWGVQGLRGDSVPGIIPYPLQKDTATTWLKVSSSNYFILGLKTDGTVWGWGKSDAGQLGDSSIYSRYGPFQIMPQSNWIDIAAGGNHSLLLNSNGELYVSGNNNLGQLGDTSNKVRYGFKKIQTSQAVRQVSASGSSSYYIDVNSDLYATGNNKYGSLGLGDTINRNVFTKVESFACWPASIASQSELLQPIVYPNPVTTELFLPVVKNTEYQILSSDARQVMQGSTNKSINVQSLPNGLYFIKFGQKFQRFIKR